MMRIIYTILSLLTIKANATNYYVSNIGSDCNNGTSESIPWQTIKKINTFAFTSGDSVLLKCGDVWNENLIVSSSNITFSSYGIGDKPLITGFQTLNGFAQSGNVWTATATKAGKGLNTVMINGKFAYKARFPNSGFLASKAPLRNDYITTVLPLSNNYIGTEVVARIKNWVLDVRKVIAQTSNTITVSSKLMYNMMDLGGFFFQNSASFIDSVGEFSFDSSTKSLSVYSTSAPSVQVSSIDTLVLINHKDYITFDNISFTGANIYTLKVDTSHNLTIKNCSINYAGSFGVWASKSRNIVIDNDTIQNCYNIGLLLGFHRTNVTGIAIDSCKKATITNNIIKNIGTVAGMASHGLMNWDGERSHVGIFMAGDSSLVKNNRVDSIGGIAVKIHGRDDSICYNYITNFALAKSDIGGLETQNTGVAADYNRGMIMYRNIIGKGIGFTYWGVANNIAAGIYFDQYVNGVTVKENTVFDCAYSSLYLLQDSNLIIRDNNLENTVDYTMLMVQSKNIYLYGNAFYQRSRTRWVFSSDWACIKQSDSNYFLRPLSPTNMIYYVGKQYSFPHLWTDSTGFDIHSKGTPAGITSTTGQLYINPTLRDSIINVNGAFVDARGNMILNSFVLKPYTSKTLFQMSMSYNTPIATR
jgi:hypothetical protein